MRVLLVLPDAAMDEGLQSRCRNLLEGGHELALCYLVPATSTLHDGQYRC